MGEKVEMGFEMEKKSVYSAGWKKKVQRGQCWSSEGKKIIHRKKIVLSGGI
jgi:hypothetical protein